MTEPRAIFAIYLYEHDDGLSVMADYSGEGSAVLHLGLDIMNNISEHASKYGAIRLGPIEALPRPQ